ncbi:mechanosensitive ion channel family protein [Pleurocapsales cyanobacterium LEGE 10410]|nr:mechanosensitive ion channel family protein [Pleurocapsales cyanobacterium LEGE 10410]
MNYLTYYNFYWLAQSAAESAGNAAKETAEQTKDLVSKITTGKVAQAIFILLATYLILKILDRVILWLSEKIAKEWRLRVKQFLPFLRMVILTSVVIILMNLFLNLSKENILAVTGTVAVALGFAFKDLVSSIIAGIVGLFESPYGVGDRIKIGDHYGEVVSYGIRSVRIRTPDDNRVTIPHNKIWTEAVSNANAGALEAQVVTEFYFAHDINIDFVKKILYRVAQTSKYTHLKLPIVVIMQEKPWGSVFKLKCYPLDARDEFVYQTDLITRAKQAFNKYQLAYPHFFGDEQLEANLNNQRGDRS